MPKAWQDSGRNARDYSKGIYSLGENQKPFLAINFYAIDYGTQYHLESFAATLNGIRMQCVL